MSKPILSYFDFPGGRGEDCRLALTIAGVDFDDDRINPKTWSDRKATTPHGALPVLTIDGRTLAQSNAILAFIGRHHDLHPTDPWRAAEHEALMEYVEELRYKLSDATVSEPEDAKKTSREAFANGYLKLWASAVESQIKGPFLDGEQINVADIKVAGVVGWFRRGGVDYIDPTYFDAYPKIIALQEGLLADPRVKAWYAA